MRELAGKVVAITGAGSGRGLALAVHFAQHKTRLALADIGEEGLLQAAAMISWSEPSTQMVDVSNQAAVEQFAAEVERMHGGADVIVNNAGVACMAAIEDVTYEEFAWVLSVNLWGAIHGVKAGHIVNIASINAYLPFPLTGRTTYRSLVSMRSLRP
jgi:NAD(P)-dependent dehydrogenase (short-subunit alcohol dehydrogenase family)